MGEGKREREERKNERSIKEGGNKRGRRIRQREREERERTGTTTSAANFTSLPVTNNDDKETLLLLKLQLTQLTLKVHEEFNLWHRSFVVQHTQQVPHLFNLHPTISSRLLEGNGGNTRVTLVPHLKTK